MNDTMGRRVLSPLDDANADANRLLQNQLLSNVINMIMNLTFRQAS